MQGGLNMVKNANRMNMAKQAQVDYMMNSKYGAQGPFADKQPSVFMTESSMQNTLSQSPKMRIQVQPLDSMMQASGSSQHRR